MLYEIAKLSRFEFQGKEASEEQKAKLMAVLVEAAYQLILFGVQFSVDQFQLCDDVERQAVIVAQKRFRVENALRIGRACRATDEVKEARLLAELDGGELHDHMLIQKTLNDWGDRNDKPSV